MNIVEKLQEEMRLRQLNIDHLNLRRLSKPALQRKAVEVCGPSGCWLRMTKPMLINSIIGKTEVVVNPLIDLEQPRSGEPIKIKIADRKPVDVGIQHPKFSMLVKMIANKKHVFMSGPAGSGKTFAAHAAAEACEVPFYSISVCQQSTKTDLQGFIDAHGKYSRTLFRRAFEEGGVFLMDEADNGNPNILNVINASLANGMAAFPDGMIKRHKNFVCVLAGNTWGQGASREYVGRNQLDKAFLSRFARIYWGYDIEFELALAPHKGWAKRVQKIRRHADSLGIRIVVTPRQSFDAGDLISCGVVSMDEAEELFIWEGVDVESKTRILNKMREEAGNVTVQPNRDSF